MTEEEIRQYENLQKHTRDYVHGMLAVEAGKLKHILFEESDRWICDDVEAVRIGTEGDGLKMTTWKGELERLMQQELGLDEESMNVYEKWTDEGDVLPIEDLLSSQPEGTTSSSSEINQETTDASDV